MCRNFQHSHHIKQIQLLWSSDDVYLWLTRNADKFSLNADDLESIEESPLNGNQLMATDDEQLSQEWAISIHSARKIQV